MKTLQECSFSSVLSVNPYQRKYQSASTNFLTKTKSPIFIKNQFSISYLNTKDFINSQIELSANIPDEDIKDAIFNKAYDELGLDQTVEYNIKFIENFSNLDTETRYFNIFIVKPSEMLEIFSNSISKIRYIDTIIPTPLLFKSLYSNNIIENTGTHCFIYIQDDDASITIYNNSEFVYTKSLKYSIQDMHEEFCEEMKEQIQYEEFINFISTKNLKETNSEYKPYLIKLYQKFFFSINEVLTFSKRAFDLTKIDKIYIDFQLPTVTKLDEMIEVELSIKSSNFNFNYNMKSDGEYIDTLHALMSIYTTLDEEKKYDCNFTVYKRPPKFIKRESGKIFILIAISSIIAFAYPVAYWALSYMQVFQLSTLDEDFSTNRETKLHREVSIKKKEKELAKAIELLKYETKEYIDKKNTLIKIHRIQVNYPMKAKIIAQLTKDLNLYDVNIDLLTYSEDKNSKRIYLHIVSSHANKITGFIKYLTKTHKEKFTFELETIIYNTESKKYFSNLKVIIL